MMDSYLVVSGILFFSAFVMGLVGFGFGIISVPLLSLTVSPKNAIPFIIVFAWLTNIISLVKYRSCVPGKIVHRLALGAIIGVPVGVFILKSLNDPLLRTLLGIVTVVYVIANFFEVSLSRINFHDRYGPFFGFASGCLTGAFGAGALPVLAFLWGKDLDKKNWKGFFHYYWLFTLSSMLFVTGYFDLLNLEILMSCFVYLPVVVAGLLFGYMVFNIVRPDYFRKFVLLVVLFVGVNLIVGR